MAVLWMVALALAGPVDEAAERAWLLSESGRHEEARATLTALIPSNPDAQLVIAYLDVSAKMGLGPQAIAETRGLAVEAPWLEAADPLGGLVAAKRTEGEAAELAQQLRTTYPDRPDLLSPLWQHQGGGKLGRLRTVVLGVPPVSPEGMARQLRLRQLVRIPDEATRVAVEEAFELDAYGSAATDVELHDHARGLAEKGMSVGQLDLRPEERRAAVLRAHGMFLAAGQPAAAAEAWAELGVLDAGAWGYRAEALRLSGDTEGSLEAAEKGLRALGRPLSRDASVTDFSARATQATQLLARASEVDLARDRGGLAWAEAVAATALAADPRGATLGPAAAQSLAATYPGADKVRAALDMAADASSLEERRRHIEGAWTALAANARRLEDVARAPELYRVSLAELWAEAATIVATAEPPDTELALAFGTLALAAGQVDAELEAHLAQWHAAEDGAIDHSHAAFHHAAVARGLGADAAEMEALVRDHHEGLGKPVEVATAVGGAPPPPEAVKAEAPKRRSVRVRGGPSKPAAGGAAIGQRVPDFELETPFGIVSRANLAGRVVLLTFFTSDDGASVEQLKVSGQLARAMRGRGIDVVHVGISRDADRGRFDDLHRVGQRWGQLAWAPQVATDFGVQRQPTTWVIDRKGIGRYFVDHRIDAAILEAQVRAVSIE